MNARKLKALEKSLNMQLEELNEGIVKDQEHFSDHSGVRFADSSDNAQEEVSRVLHFGLNRRSQMTADQIRSTLKKIESGEFGECIECGEEIEEKRIFANPTTTLCIECQEDWEQAEERKLRHFGN
jgi:DnaK suppressor protein